MTETRRLKNVVNAFPIATMLNKINVKKNSISNFESNTFIATTLYKLLIKVLSEVISFVFKSKVRGNVGFSKTSIYWTSNVVGRRYFTEQNLVNAIYFLINKCLVTLLVIWFFNKIFVYQLALTHLHFGPTFLYFFESKHIKQLILNECFQALMTFDDNEFLTCFKNIYPKELDLKVESQGNHVSFFDLDIKVEDSVFVYKSFDKRDKFSLFIVRMPHLLSNIPTMIL